MIGQSKPRVLAKRTPAGIPPPTGIRKRTKTSHALETELIGLPSKKMESYHPRLGPLGARRILICFDRAVIAEKSCRRNINALNMKLLREICCMVPLGGGV